MISLNNLRALNLSHKIILKILSVFVPLWLIFHIINLLSCDHGIDPKNWAEPGFSGKITFMGKIPPKDSLYDLRLVVYKKYPPPNFFEFVKFSDSIPLNQNPYQYTMLIQPGTYEYIVVAQQYGPNLFLHWRAVGFYSLLPGKQFPSAITIDENTFLTNIDITVDFDHLPIQPFLNINNTRTLNSYSFY